MDAQKTAHSSEDARSLPAPDSSSASSEGATPAGPNSHHAAAAAAAAASTREVKADEPAPPPPPPETVHAHLNIIPANLPIVLRLPSTKHKPVTLVPGRTVSLGKFGAFRADDLIGMPFGHTYEIVGGNPHKNKAGDLRMVANKTLADIEETDATNEYINDDGESQKLTYVDIKQLKDAGLGGRELIERTLQSNKNFEQRTVYSQDKFISRKEAKHMKLFTPLHPDAATLCAFHFERAPEKIRFLRPDALAHCLAYGSVRPGGRYIVVDGVGGLLVGAILERLGGQGRVLLINDADSPPAFDILTSISSLPKSWVEQPLRVLHWAATERAWQPSIIPPVDDPKRFMLDRDRARLQKRRGVYDTLQATRAELFAGFFDGFLMASNFEPLAVLERIQHSLAGSAKIVVHSPYQQPLVETQAELRKRDEWLHVEVVEPWSRRYQVLPGRTHPEMNTSATGGYILSSIKVFDADTAERLAAEHRQEVADAVLAQVRAANAMGTGAAAAGNVRKDAPVDEGDGERDPKRAKVAE
ncbi:tRNA (adenine(58)-N(1))-methyltransferase non-catalytic subunit trm6 [Tilletia horrida]|nr:tRNA (adenine(58)-N(1))-methyltransferase non-catalytic subunit trm6 [Tilletia horrida]